MDDEFPSVSVVIPCYNVAPFVARAVRSAAHQTFSPVEIICVDDGSTDNSRPVLQELADEFPGLVRVICVPHAGGSAARIKGLARATGEYIQFLDADDELLPSKLEYQLRLQADAHTRADIVVGACLWMGQTTLPRFRGPSYSDIWANLVSGNLGITSANLWRRDAVRKVKGWNEEQESSQEYELMFRMLKENASTFLSYEPLTRKIDEPGCLTSVTGRPNKIRERNLLDAINLRIAIAGYMQGAGIMTEDIEHVYYPFMHNRIKTLYPYNPQRALELHEQVMPLHYQLKNSDGGGIDARDDLHRAPKPYVIGSQQAQPNNQ